MDIHRQPKLNMIGARSEVGLPVGYLGRGLVYENTISQLSKAHLADWSEKKIGQAI